MESWLEKLLLKVPDLGVFAWLVITFLRYLRDWNNAREATDAKRDEAYLSLHDACHKLQAGLALSHSTDKATANAAILAATQQLAANSDLLRQVQLEVHATTAAPVPRPATP